MQHAYDAFEDLNLFGYLTTKHLKTLALTGNGHPWSRRVRENYGTTEIWAEIPKVVLKSSVLTL